MQIFSGTFAKQNDRPFETFSIGHSKWQTREGRLQCIARLCVVLVTAKIQAWGNSVCLPKTLLAALGVKNGASVEVELKLIQRASQDVLENALAIIDASVF